MLIFLSFLSCFLTLSSGLECPAEIDSGPCSCRSWNDWSTLVCRGLQEVQLRTVLSRLRHLDVQGALRTDKLVIEDSRGVEGVSFLNASLQGLELGGVTLGDCPVLDQNALLNTFFVRDIDSNVDSWDWSRLCRVRHLKISRVTSLTSLSLSAWNHGAGLVSLTVTDCKRLTSLKPGALKAMSGLAVLDLTRNGLLSLTRDALPDPSFRPELSLLDLSFNQLSSIPPDLLTGLPKLTTIKLDSNRLLTIEERLVQCAGPSLKQIDFFNNPYAFNCDCSLDWILWTSQVEVGVACIPRTGQRRIIKDYLLRNCGPNAITTKRRM